ncbi:MAG: ABC transporter ATP-binding protein/permease [Candidatus Rokubacteria bacterium]|nr:ABC transporter ATP-binding protein/permease [Candidatus Rokubacteria bacterium]
MRRGGGGGAPEDADPDLVLGKAYDAQIMRRLWALTRAHRPLMLGSILLFPLIAAAELLQPYLIKVAIDDHILRGDWVGLGGVAALFLLLLVLLYVLRAVQGYLLSFTGQRVMYDLRETLFAHLQKQDAAFFDRNPVGRLMTRVLNDVEAVTELFTSGVVAVIGDVVTLAGVVAIMLVMDWRLALVTFALVPVLVLVAGYFRINARRSYRHVRARLAALNGFLQESLQGMTVVQLFAREREEARQFGDLNGGLRAAQFRSTFYEASLYAAVEAIGSAAVALLLWYGGGQVMTGALTFGALVAFLEYTGRFFLPIRDLGAKYTVMQAAMVSSERIFGLLDTEPAIRTGSVRPIPAAAPAGGDAPDAGSRAAPAVEFRRVWFAYEGEDWVLRDCSFQVAAGEQVALVGPTGEGKSTIVRLMLRAYEAGRGQVLVDGIDVRDWDLHALRRHVGLVPQDVFLFTGTVEANLRAAGGDGLAPEAIAEALALTHADRVVAALPQGLGEEIRERGLNLSQGQRQLLAIARALIYNPRVLALDEATSSVDPESETLIRAAMSRLLEDRTSVVIAHRLSTVQRADRILVLHRGRVRESGRHSELVGAGGLYAQLVEVQFGTAAT